jgi:hypothetical protein
MIIRRVDSPRQPTFKDLKVGDVFTITGEIGPFIKLPRTVFGGEFEPIKTSADGIQISEIFLATDALSRLLTPANQRCISHGLGQLRHSNLNDAHDVFLIARVFAAGLPLLRSGSEATALVYTNTTSTTPQSNNIPSLKYLSYRLELQREGRQWRVTKMSTVTSLDLTPKL